MSGSRWRGRAADAGLVLGVGLVALVGLVVQSRGIDTAAESAALLAVLASSGALYVRRRHPVPVGVVALAAVGAYGALLHKTGPIMLVFVVALYTVVDEGHLRVAIGLGLASVIAFAVADSDNRSPDTRNGATLLHAGWLVAVIVGVTRNRRAYLAEAQARAVAAEQRLEEEARRRATEERLRIARELHDVLGHHLSLINVQASAALHRPRPRPVRAGAHRDQGRPARRRCASCGRRWACCGRRARRRRARARPRPPRRPDHHGRRGPSWTIRTEFAETRPLPPEVDLAAYRIVQEALTNVARHAGATAAVVRVRPDRDDVLVEVEDDGTGAPGAPRQRDPRHARTGPRRSAAR